MPLAEAQGQWIADYLARRVRAAAAAPSCCATSSDERRAMRKRYVASKRHTMQVDFDDYLHALEQGAPARRRAGARGRLPRCRCAPRGAAREARSPA